MSRFFIDRPIFAIVVALLLVIIGAIAGFSLPIAQYPQISPPTVSVQPTYTGASGKVVNDTVAQVIEQQVNGTQGMDYMSSTSDDSGAYTLNVYFELGTNGDMDSVLVQNNVSIATSSLPSEVTAYGVTTKKSSQDMTLVGAVSSPNGSFDRNFIKNYLDIYLIDQIKRVHGVGDVNVFATNYTMRVWLNPDKIAELGITDARPGYAGTSVHRYRAGPSRDAGGFPARHRQGWGEWLLRASRRHCPHRARSAADCYRDLDER